MAYPALRIAELNDQLRARFGLRAEEINDAATVRGRFVLTPGIAAMSAQDLQEMCKHIRAFDAFTPGNDPYGEHDFGTLHFKGDTVFWKIDYFADADCLFGTEHADDPKRSYRVMTVMLAEEY